MFSDKQKLLISKAIALGYGYQKFARNVEAQGFCSSKQEKSLDSMVSIGEYRRKNWPKFTSMKKKRLSYKHDISDCEAMSFGEYF